MNFRIYLCFQIKLQADLEKVKKRKEERAVEKARHEEDMSMLARQEFQYWEKKEEEEEEEVLNKVTVSPSLSGEVEKSDDGPEILHGNYGDGLTKPKYFNRVHSGYEWNKYNRTHYDHDNPPPKTVQGYKFNIYYPDLDLNKTKAPTYTIEKDGSSSETCILRFHAGAPYQDMVCFLVSWSHTYDFSYYYLFL